MTTADEYRQFAEECLRWADKAKTAKEKKAFLDMAQTWIKAAAKLTNGRAGPNVIQPPAHEPEAPAD
jgi:hypothetical protein